MDSDRVMVLAAGKISEFDTPQRLLANPNSMFASLVRESAAAGAQNMQANPTES
jgi:ATP-binding cassette subfamily C (CFTR/MRP) protein 1